MPPRIIVNPIALSKAKALQEQDQQGANSVRSGANLSGQLTSRSGGRTTAQQLQQQPLRSGRGRGSAFPPQTPLTSRSGTGASPRVNFSQNIGTGTHAAAAAAAASRSANASATPRNNALTKDSTSPTPRSPRTGGRNFGDSTTDDSDLLAKTMSLTMGRSGKLNTTIGTGGAVGGNGKLKINIPGVSKSGDATPSVRSENLDLNYSRVMSGAFIPKLAVSASRADIVLSLQQKLREAYAPLILQTERGLLFPPRSSSSSSSSAPLTSARYARRRAIFNDPTQRATLSVFREDSAVLEQNNTNITSANSNNNNNNNNQNDFGGASSGYQAQGFTCVEDSLPARLAIFQSDHVPGASSTPLGNSGNNINTSSYMPDQHGSLVVISGHAGIGKSLIWKNLCAQQRVPGALVIHVPLIKLRDINLENNTSNAGKNDNKIERIDDLIRIIEAPLSSTDVNQVVRHRIPIVWCLDGFESERRYCQEFLHIMITMKKSREIDDAQKQQSSGFDFEAANDNIFGESVEDPNQITDLRDYHDLKQRYIDTTVLTSVDGSISVNPNSEKQDSLLALQKLTTTSLASISATTQQRVSNIERWTVQRWPMGITKEFIRKYCTGKAKPHKIINNVNSSPSPQHSHRSASPSPRTNNNINNQSKIPSEDYLWNTVLSLNQMGSLIGVPLFLQCICDVFIGNEELLEPLRVSGNPKVTLFELCLKLQWSKQLPYIETILASSANKNTNNNNSVEENDFYNSSFRAAGANTDAAFEAMADAAGKYCVELLARGGMECDVIWSQKRKTDVEPLWIQLLAVLGVVRKIKLTTNNDSDGSAAAAASSSSAKFTIVFHNRLLVEYFAACHISRHPEKLTLLQYHTRNRFLWMALTFMSSENSRVLSQKGILKRITEKYSEDHPLWLDSFVSYVSQLFVDRYKTLADDLRHDRRKSIPLGNYTHTPLLVEMSTVLGSNAASLMSAVKRRHGLLGATFKMPSHFMWSFELCGDFGAAATLNWIIDNYKDSITQNKSLLSRTLARALQREQLGSITSQTIDEASPAAAASSPSPARSATGSSAAGTETSSAGGGVITRLYELGATIELFTAVRLGSTTAVAECFETPEFTLDADSYRQCLMIAVENRDSDMAALLLSHARCAELLDAWIVAVVFILRPRVRFTNKSVQRKPEKLLDGTLGRTRTSSIYGSPERSTRNLDNDENDGEGGANIFATQMTTLEFLEDWTNGCTGLHPDQLQQVDELLKIVLQRQLDYERVHTQAAELAGGRGSMIAHNFQAAINKLNLNKKEQEQLLKMTTQQQQRRMNNNNNSNSEHNSLSNSSNSAKGTMSSAAAAVAALAAMHPANRSSSSTDDVTNSSDNNNDNDDDDDNSNTKSNSNNNNSNSADHPPPLSHTRTLAQLATTATFGGLNTNTALDQIMNSGLQYCVEVRVDAIFWWMVTDPKEAARAIPPENPSEVSFLAFDEFPNSFQLDTIVGTIGDCDSVRHVSLRLQECEQLSDATLISLVQSVGTKLVELGVTYATDITDAAMLSLARYCPHLAAIDATRCYCLTNKSLEAFAQNFRSSLRKLVMEFVCLVDDEGLITIVEHAPNLDTLDISFCKELTDSSMFVVAQKCPNLEYLRLDGCELLTDASLIAVTENCGKLRTLKFRDVVEISSEGVAAAARHCRGLQAIDMSFCWKIDDKGISALAKYCRDLQELWITECSAISEKSLVALFSQNSNFRTIDMSGCFKLTDECLKILADESFATLENLAISRCDKISDSAVSKICSDCIYLRSLYISFCDLLTDKSLVSILSDGKRVIDLQCAPSVVQESKNAFSEYLINALIGELDKRRLYEEQNGKMCPVDEEKIVLKRKLAEEKNKNRKINTSKPEDTPVIMTPRFSPHTPPVTPRNKVPPKYKKESKLSTGAEWESSANLNQQQQ